MSSAGTRVFVGNIPYDGTEQQLVDLFSSVGTVVSFSLATDRETGKPKGFGFCTFKDPEIARSAIRNLNGAEFHGRSLRVDFSTEDKMDANVVTDATGPVLSAPEPSMFAQNPIAKDTLMHIISGIKDEEKVEILSQFKILIQQTPEAARDILSQNPQLAQALLHILANFGILSYADIAAFASQPPPISQAPVPGSVPPAMASGPMVGPPPTGPAGIIPPRMRQPMMEPAVPISMGQTPREVRGLPPRDFAPAPPANIGPLAHLPPEQQAELERLLSLSPEQLASLNLAPEMLAQIQQIRQTMQIGSMPHRVPMDYPPPPPPRGRRF